MKDTRNYINQNLRLGSVLLLSRQASQHMVKVLRKEVGSLIEVFDGRGSRWHAKILNVKSALVEIEVISESIYKEREGVKIILGQTLIKPDPFSFSIQKATELGVHTISPLISDRTVVNIKKESLEKRLHKWSLISQGACEQCGEDWMPVIEPPQRTSDWSKSVAADTKIVLYPGGRSSITNIRMKDSIAVAIGPEGDFTDNEIQMLEKDGFVPVSMGQRILRAETATISALSVIRTMSGEF